MPNLQHVHLAVWQAAGIAGNTMAALLHTLPIQAEPIQGVMPGHVLNSIQLHARYSSMHEESDRL